MAHDNEPLTPEERELIGELRQLYHEEAQAVDRRLDGVWRRLEQHPAMRQRRQEAMTRGRVARPDTRRPRSTAQPLTRLPAPRAWSVRASALAAAVLLVVLVGGLAAGLILVRRGNTIPGRLGQQPLLRCFLRRRQCPAATSASIPLI